MTKTMTIKEARDESIAHWERMLADPGCGELPQSEDCPLCQLFPTFSCVGCPVYERTGEGGCEVTPFLAAHVAFWKYQDTKTEADLEAWRTAARAEIDFLKSLHCD